MVPNTQERKGRLTDDLAMMTHEGIGTNIRGGPTRSD